MNEEETRPNTLSEEYEAERTPYVAEQPLSEGELAEVQKWMNGGTLLCAEHAVLKGTDFGCDPKKFIALITAYRQLEKDYKKRNDSIAVLIDAGQDTKDDLLEAIQANAELLAALKDIRDIAEGNYHWSIKRILEIAEPLYSKHKGE